MRKGISDESLMIVFFLFIAFLGMLVWFASVQDQFMRFGRVTIEKEEVIFLPEKLEYNGKTYEFVRRFCANEDGVGGCDVAYNIKEPHADTNTEKYFIYLFFGPEYTFKQENLLLFVVRIAKTPVVGTFIIEDTYGIGRLVEFPLSPDSGIYENIYIPNTEFSTQYLNLTGEFGRDSNLNVKEFITGVYVEEHIQ